MRSIEVRVPVPATDGSADPWFIAATVHLPDRPPSSAPVLVVLPGGGYNRRYYDLPVQGFSQAAHHVARGTIVVAVDYLGGGDSFVPAFDVSDLPTVAGATHVGVADLLDRLRGGTLADEVPAVEVSTVVGAGHSLGGHVLIGMQGTHRTFDAVATLGSSMAGTALPLRPGALRTTEASTSAPDDDVAALMAGIDFVWAFHWIEPPTADTCAAPHDLHSLIATDISMGIPARHRPALWGTDHYPACGSVGMIEGAMAGFCAAVDVPVLLVIGERDVCRVPGAEVATFAAATDIAYFWAPQMAHMHNFAETRSLIWHRLDEFVARAQNFVGAAS